MLIWGPDYACCGVPFGVGDEVGFSLRAVPGGGGGDGAGAGGGGAGGGGDGVGAGDGPTFFDDRHPMDPDDPPIDVRGRVEAIVAVHQRLVPVAGAHYRTSDPDDTVERAVESVPVDERPDGYSGADYRVVFRIPDGTRLPEPRAATASAGADRRRGAEPSAELLPLLTAIVEEVAERFGDRVGILRARADASVTLDPGRRDACAVRWNAGADALSVELEQALWSLPADASGAATLRALVEAAATGGFSETLEAGRFGAVARTPDGAVWTAAAEASSFPMGGWVVAMSGSTDARMRRARSGTPYPAWG